MMLDAPSPMQSMTPLLWIATEFLNLKTSAVVKEWQTLVYVRIRWVWFVHRLLFKTPVSLMATSLEQPGLKGMLGTPNDCELMAAVDSSVSMSLGGPPKFESKLWRSLWESYPLESKVSGVSPSRLEANGRLFLGCDWTSPSMQKLGSGKFVCTLQGSRQ